MIQYRFVILFLIIIMTAACAPKIKTEVIMPAGSGKATEYKNIAILPFEGNIGAGVTAKIENMMKNAVVKGNYFFKVYDRTAVNKILAEQSFQMTLGDPEKAVKFGRLAGVKGLYTGFASEDTKIWYYSKSIRVCTAKNDKGECTAYGETKEDCKKVSVTVSMTPKLIDVSTSEIVFSSNYVSTKSDDACANRIWSMSEPSELIEIAADSVIYDFRKDIAPYQKVITIKLKKADDSLDKEEKNIFKGALEFADSGRLDRACEIWKTFNNKDSLALAYNLGVCAEAFGNLENALALYQNADKLLVKPDSLVNEALDRIVNLINARNEVNKQIQ